jgi:hypothetical protein
MDPTAENIQLRQACFEHVNRLAALSDGVLGSDDTSRPAFSSLASGFRRSIRSALFSNLGR